MITWEEMIGRERGKERKSIRVWGVLGNRSSKGQLEAWLTLDMACQKSPYLGTIMCPWSVLSRVPHTIAALKAWQPGYTSV